MDVNKKKFIILTTQRTGSTYLRIWLNQHPEIRSHGEIYLNRYQAPDGFNAFLKENSIFKQKIYQSKFFHKLSKAFNGWLIKILLHSELKKFIYDFFRKPTHPLGFNRFKNDEIFNITEAKEKNNVANIGFKIMYGQLKSNLFLKKWIEKEKPKIIYVERKDKLAICYSKLIKSKLGFAHSEQPILQNKFLGDKRFFKKCIKKQILLENQILKFIEGKNYLKISYEDFFYDNNTKYNILKYLEVSENFSKEISLKKINKQSPSEVLKNYNEISNIVNSIKNNYTKKND